MGFIIETETYNQDSLSLKMLFLSLTGFGTTADTTLIIPLLRIISTV